MSDALFSVFAVQAAGPEANPLSLFFPFILVFAVMYFFILRPQQKQRRELQQMVEALKKGDRVETIGGIIGTIAGIQKDYVVLKTGDSDNTKMEVLKTAISALRKE
ncbi:MAG: preprotein translocase subunit YajC [Candidatus Omnitrophica bacterium]|nr:preprotein translocase subunit YajC [Candidatus Omnitrophota bacterium]